MSRASQSSKSAAAATSDGSASALEVYETTGNASAALQTLVASPANPTNAYNQALLEAMVGEGGNKQNGNLNHFMERLKTAESAVTASSNSSEATAGKSRKRRREEWTMVYNRSLLLLSQGKPKTSTAQTWTCLHSAVLTEMQDKVGEEQLSQDMLQIACRMALLILEGIISLSMGNFHGIPPVWAFDDVLGDLDNATDKLPPLQLDALLSWLNKAVDKARDNAQLKFSLSLYAARMDFLQRDPHGKLEDSKIRSARKELKQAMEIFQHKIKNSGDTGSLASSTTNPDPQANTSNASTNGVSGHSSINASGNHNVQDPIVSRIAQGQLQSALNLKANAEQLKGNIKKSLILCGEAQTAFMNSNQDAAASKSSYDATHYNNLAIVYAASQKPHLAVHAWSKALASTSPASIHSDGTLHVDESAKILHNAAIGSLQAKNFLAAYECMGLCLQHSETFRSRSRCWIRLGEACLGIWSQREHKQDMINFAAINVDGEPKGIMLGAGVDDPDDIAELSPNLTSPEDMQQIHTNPLPRAQACYRYALKLLENDVENATPDIFATISSQLSLSYIGLEQKNVKDALKFADLVLEHKEPAGIDTALTALFKRQQATASMYAAEASCLLGDAVASMKYLVGDGQNDAFDRLASDLAGVSIQTAASQQGSEGKTRLAQAQAMVRCSASAASAQMGNLSAAKQLAMSAQAMSRDGPYVTRALVYCMLREGNKGAALSLLRSSR